jgi:type IV secretion system protein VirB10
MKKVTVLSRVVVLFLLGFAFVGACLAQSLVPAIVTATQAPAKPAGAEPEITIPAGTKVVMALRSPVHTVSTTPESGLYLESVFTVVAENRVVIPAHTRVQGSVTRTARPGRVKGRGYLQFHFSTLILPNNYVLPISGRLASLSGSAGYEKKVGDVIQPVDQIDKDVATIATVSAAGAIFGSLSYGSVSTLRGSAIGAVVGLGKVLFTRGDDIRLLEGTRVEMVLDEAVNIPISHLDFPAVKSEVPVPRPPQEETQSSSRQPQRRQSPIGLGSILFPH